MGPELPNRNPSMGVPSSLGAPALIRSWGQGHHIDSTPTGLGSREARLENWGGKRAISTLRWWWHKSWWVSGSPWGGDLMCRLAWGWTQAHRLVALCYSSMEEGWRKRGIFQGFKSWLLVFHAWVTLASSKSLLWLHLSICLMVTVALSLQIVKVRDKDGQEFSKDLGHWRSSRGNCPILLENSGAYLLMDHWCGHVRIGSLIISLMV